MDELEVFVKKLKRICDEPNKFDVLKARAVIKEMNEFLYTNYPSIGTVTALGSDWNYFSEFHRYWHIHHKEILNLRVDDTVCAKVADILHEVFIRTDGKVFSSVYDTDGLTKEQICRVRLLTANQDFRGSRNFLELARLYRSDPSRFDVRRICDDPEDFIKLLGINRLSQNDKRVQYAQNITRFLLAHNAEPFEIIDKFNRDVTEFRSALIEANSGFGNKKTDMFIRDMVLLNVWDNVINFDQINVASDINTIKVALRTGILKSEIPLVSSFLDIFDCQYSYVDDMNVKAWRRVWEIWNEKYNDNLASPCLLDYFVYNVVGKQFCKTILYVFRCNTHAHEFKWHSARNRTCQICAPKKEYCNAVCIGKLLPCCDEEGSIAIQNTDFYKLGLAKPNYTVCPFKVICSEYGKQKLQPPKSISIMGATGWTSAYTDKDAGGGGLMA